MRLLITRPQEECKPIEGHEAIYFPLIEILPPKDGGTSLQKILKNSQQFDWLVVTSQNTVHAIQTYCSRLSSHLKVAVVGPQTAEAVKPLTPNIFVPPQPNGVAGLLQFFKTNKMEGQRVAYPRSDIGRKELAVGLGQMGAEVVEVEAYQTKPTDVSRRQLKNILADGIDAVLFFSPSAVASFFSKMEANDPLLKKIDLVAVGQTTRRALKFFRNNLDRSFSL